MAPAEQAVTPKSDSLQEREVASPRLGSDAQSNHALGAFQLSIPGEWKRIGSGRYEDLLIEVKGQWNMLRPGLTHRSQVTGRIVLDEALEAPVSGTLTVKWPKISVKLELTFEHHDEPCALHASTRSALNAAAFSTEVAGTISRGRMDWANVVLRLHWKSIKDGLPRLLP